MFLTGVYDEIQNMQEDGSVSAILKVREVNDKTLLFPVRVQSASLPEEEPGCAFTGVFEVGESEESSYSRYALSKGVSVCAWPVGLIETKEGDDSLRYLLSGVREKQAQRLYRLTGSSGPGAICTAMLLGEKTYLTDEISAAFRKGGVSHLLVVSGLHLTLLVGVLLGVLRSFRLSARAKQALSVAGTVLLMAFFGFTPSVSRAGIMLIVGFMAPFFGRENDPPSSLGMAILLILTAKPCAVLDVGLLLSAASVLGLMSCEKVLSKSDFAAGEKEKGKTLLLRAFLPSTFAALFTLPVLALFGGGVSLFSPITNFLCVPLSMPVLLFSGGALLLSYLPFCAFFAKAAAFLAVSAAQLLYTAAALFNRLQVGYFFLKGLFPLAVLLACFFLWRLFVRQKWPKPACAFFIAAFFLFAVGANEAFCAGRLQLVEVGSKVGVIAREGEKTVVVYTGTARQIGDMEYELEKQGVAETDKIINLSSPQLETALRERLHGENIFSVREMQSSIAAWSEHGILIKTLLDEKGRAAAVTFKNGSFLCYQGKPNLSAFGQVSVLFLSDALPRNAAADLCVVKGEPAWCGFAKEMFVTLRQPVLWLREGQKQLSYGEI